ncbi:MAG TPA: signal peptidase I [Rhabdochlamydiaceae bacterium]|nr:signal peptidase I [Rhabdochlamydiaceae bacterium]
MKNHYKTILFAIIALTIVTWAFAHPYNVPGDCMEPAIKDGSHVFVNHVSPYIRQYRIGDIIAFNHEGKGWVSRIVAVEADTVQITEGNVIVNGTTCQDGGILRSWSNWKHGNYAIDKPLQVPPAHVFVLSDNLSAQHDDSRIFGPISKDSIIGLVW